MKYTIMLETKIKLLYHYKNIRGNKMLRKF